VQALLSQQVSWLWLGSIVAASASAPRHHWLEGAPTSTKTEKLGHEAFKETRFLTRLPEDRSPPYLGREGRQEERRLNGFAKSGACLHHTGDLSSSLVLACWGTSH
jgi:hypothetical protein